MGFMLGDPFNYSPVRKMAEAITFRSVADGKPDCPLACGNAEAMVRPYTLKQYYLEDMQSGGDNHHNRPFSSFFVRGNHLWKDDDYTLKLSDTVGWDGATKLDIESGWLVRLRIGAKYAGSTSVFSEDSGRGMSPGLFEDFEDGSNLNIIVVDVEKSPAGYYYTTILLDGDEGDYVSIDLDAEYADIGQFVIKVGGTSYSLPDKFDLSGNTEDVRIELIGVSYKPYFAQDDTNGDGTEVVEGCTDSAATNFDSSATDDDGTCEYVEDTSCTINSQCAEGEICESGTCIEKIEGCLDSNSNEYDSSANVEDGTCISCKTGYEKDATGLCSTCVEGYSKNAAGICYEDEEESDFPWLVVAGLGIALVLVIS